MKTPMSRFQIHDELSAPEGSVPVLRGAVAAGGQVPNFLGVLAGSPAALRAYVRFRSELRHGTLSAETLERISLAVAQTRQSQPDLALHVRAARRLGLSVDDVALAREFDAVDVRESVLLRYLRPLVEEGQGAGPPRPRGGARGRMERRAAPGGHRLRGARAAHGDGERRRRGAGRRLRRADALAARRLSTGREGRQTGHPHPTGGRPGMV